jgi:hypothetical protein
MGKSKSTRGRTGVADIARTVRQFEPAAGVKILSADIKRKPSYGTAVVLRNGSRLIGGKEKL